MCRGIDKKRYTTYLAVVYQLSVASICLIAISIEVATLEDVTSIKHPWLL
jgi:hypothetical protein